MLLYNTAIKLTIFSVLHNSGMANVEMKFPFFTAEKKELRMNLLFTGTTIIFN
jgi:hypothetical protein